MADLLAEVGGLIGVDVVDETLPDRCQFRLTVIWVD